MHIERELTYWSDTSLITVYPYVAGQGYTGWISAVWRTVTFDGTQTVSKEFYEWFTANAQKVT